MYGLALSILISVASGFALTSILWPGHKSHVSLLVLRIFLSVGLGFGMSACGFFVWLILFGGTMTAFILAEIAVLLGLIVVFLLMRRPSGADAELALGAQPVLQPGVTPVLLTVALLLLVAGAASFALIASVKPHGDWDTFANWNLRARFLFRGPDQWQRAFLNTIPRRQGNYPPLVTLQVARSWHYAGKDSVVAPMTVAALFALANVGLVFSALCVLRGRTQALLGGIVLLATPVLIMQAPVQYADIPLAFFILATVVLLTLHGRFGESGYGLLALAGLACGFAAFTKNEGIPFLIWLVLIAVVCFVRTGDRKTGLRRLRWFAAGLAAPLVMLIYFKVVVATGAAHLARLTVPDVLGRLASPSRYLQIARAFVEQIFRIDRWGVFPVILPFYLLLLGARAHRSDKWSVRIAFLLLGLMVLTHFGVFVVTRWDLNWLLTATADRLLLQLWPTAVFAFFLVARRPEDAVSAD